MNLARFIPARQGVTEERQRRYDRITKMIEEGKSSIENKRMSPIERFIHAFRR